MQANVVITATATSNGKKLTTTISYVNQKAANSKLSALAQKLNSLTTNVYVSASKEIKGEIL